MLIVALPFAVLGVALIAIAAISVETTLVAKRRVPWLKASTVALCGGGLLGLAAAFVGH